jgi:hypothetical protein
MAVGWTYHPAGTPDPMTGVEGGAYWTNDTTGGISYSNPNDAGTDGGIPLPGVLDPVAKAAQQDIFDTTLDSSRTKSYLGSQMHRGYRSSFLLGPRGTEGGDWVKNAIDWSNLIDGKTVQGYDPSTLKPGTLPGGPPIMPNGAVNPNSGGLLNADPASSAPAIANGMAVAFLPEPKRKSSFGGAAFGDLGKWYQP